MTALLHGGGIKKWEGIVYVDPQYYTQQMYMLAHPQSPVATTTREGTAGCIYSFMVEDENS